MSQGFYTTGPILIGGVCSLASSFFARNHVESSVWPYVLGGFGVFMVGFGMFGTWVFCRDNTEPIFGWISFVFALVLLLPAFFLYRAAPYGFLAFLCAALLVIGLIGILIIHVRYKPPEQS